MVKHASFNSIYQPEFKNNELVLQVPGSAVVKKANNVYEVHLPVYAGRALAIGGNILRRPRKEYRDWLLKEQNGLCAICGEGEKPGDEWNLDHQPPLSEPGCKFIDYEKTTRNRVIHHYCDPSQKKKQLK